MAGKRELIESFGSYQVHHVDEHNLTGKNHFLMLEDCTQQIEMCKRFSELEPGKEFRYAAEIPHHVWWKAVRDGWVNDRQAWKRWANNPDNKAFRVWPGRL
jgi:hypothetical protein